MTYNHISKEDRRRIEALTQAGSTNKEITAVLGKSACTIGRELKRNSWHGARCYDCERAQKLTEKRRKDSKGPKISEKTWKEVFELFNLDLSPEQIASVVKISYESIYRRIYAKIRAIRKKIKGTFWKKFPLNPQKQGSGPAPLSFCNSVAKYKKVLREFERSFAKDLSKFSNHKTIVSCLNAPVYFAHTHCPWECFIG